MKPRGDITRIHKTKGTAREACGFSAHLIPDFNPKHSRFSAFRALLLARRSSLRAAALSGGGR